MKLVRPQGQKCTFRICCDRARQASLVIDMFPGMSQIFSLKPTGNGVWETELSLPPGEYRFCYHLYDGRSLQYITPEDMETDGLKSVLHVGTSSTSTITSKTEDAPTDQPQKQRHDAHTPLTSPHHTTLPTMLRRAAG